MLIIDTTSNFFGYCWLPVSYVVVLTEIRKKSEFYSEETACRNKAENLYSRNNMAETVCSAKGRTFAKGSSSCLCNGVSAIQLSAMFGSQLSDFVQFSSFLLLSINTLTKPYFIFQRPSLSKMKRKRKQNIPFQRNNVVAHDKYKRKNRRQRYQ